MGSEMCIRDRQCGTQIRGHDGQIVDLRLERDEDSGVCTRTAGSWCNYAGKYVERSYTVPDHETAALKRIDDTCKRIGIHYYIQDDPRGETLYIAAKPIHSNTYSTTAMALYE